MKSGGDTLYVCAFVYVILLSMSCYYVFFPAVDNVQKIFVIFWATLIGGVAWVFLYLILKASIDSPYIYIIDFFSSAWFFLWGSVLWNLYHEVPGHFVMAYVIAIFIIDLCLGSLFPLMIVFRMKQKIREKNTEKRRRKEYDRKMKQEMEDEERKKKQEQDRRLAREREDEKRRIEDEKRRIEDEKKSTIENSRTFYSSIPEELFGNIAEIHQRAIAFIKEDNIEEAIEDLEAEKSQYEAAISRLVEMGLGVLIEKAKKKAEQIDMLLYRAREQMKIRAFRELAARIVLDREKEYYELASESLQYQEEIIKELISLASEAGNKEDLEKYSALYEDLKENIAYNNNLVDYKIAEYNYNQAQEMVQNGQLEAALRRIRYAQTTISILIERLNSEQRQQLKNLRVLSVKLRTSLTEAETMVIKGYEQMIERNQVIELKIEPLSFTFNSPKDIEVEQPENLEGYLSYLDEQFVLWEKGQQDKSSKPKR